MRFNIASLPSPQEVRNHVEFLHDATRDYDATVAAARAWLEGIRDAECTPHDGMNLDEAHKRAAAWPLIVGDAMLTIMGL